MPTNLRLARKTSSRNPRDLVFLGYGEKFEAYLEKTQHDLRVEEISRFRNEFFQLNRMRLTWPNRTRTISVIQFFYPFWGIETAQIAEVIKAFNEQHSASAVFMPVHYISDYVPKTAAEDASGTLANRQTQNTHAQRLTLLDNVFATILAYLKASPYIR